ncbi:DUF2933 domain-containing protein [Shewanella sp. CG12_big_fil_rev_8_21_14_0_65_47_15]|uniref:DUF2933 domain-containing protein n=1 Tax=Shewanella sp. CG12_big_fil_rev_8_21_14_0_65_47_15 TaxID=1975537 RepID=UPI000CC7BF06|nr:DUF2933 domain-containing protein [Shewanella sp. CG12_big_fil_rev_8_21_14_0_65_47_15]PIW62771.1 MAG: hypothetical protein COW15_01805 [Shewanella sp. CG12_big_fil_rev_8_21_14_0_65_47_15]
MAKQRCSFWSTPQGWAAIGMIAAVSYFLFMEHRQHLFEFLPLLILLACPLMHVFMHHGHRHEHLDRQVNDDPHGADKDGSHLDPKSNRENDDAR